VRLVGPALFKHEQRESHAKEAAVSSPEWGTSDQLDDALRTGASSGDNYGHLSSTDHPRHQAHG
jgi:hypothetical protein